MYIEKNANETGTFEKKILLYGAATMGIKVEKILSAMRVKVSGFIDERGKEIKSLKEIPVFTIQQMEKSIDKDRSIIFISVKNVFEHDQIALNLVKAGYSKLLFRPGSVLRGEGSPDEKRINEIYDLVLEGNFDFSERIPLTETVELPQCRDYVTLSKFEGRRVVSVPIPLVYTDNDGPKEIKWVNKNILTLYPHIELFQSMLGDKSCSYKSYIDFCKVAANEKGSKITKAWEKSVIRNRSEVFENMSCSYEYDQEFFIRNAAPAIWNEKGYFNLVSGKHRATFFVAKGQNSIPLNISEEDYNKWLNIKKVDEIVNDVHKEMILKISAPIEHPYFVGYPCINRSALYIVLSKTTQKMAKLLIKESNELNFQEKSIYIRIEDNGFLKRHFLRMGLEIACENNSDEKKEKKLNNLFNLSQDIGTKRVKYDFAIIYYNDKVQMKAEKPDYATHFFIISPDKIASHDFVTDVNRKSEICLLSNMFYNYKEMYLYYCKIK